MLLEIHVDVHRRFTVEITCVDVACPRLKDVSDPWV